MEFIIGDDHYLGCLEQWTPSNNHTLFEELDHFISKNAGKHILVFISYDIKNHIENLETRCNDTLNFPEILCVVPEKKNKFSAFNIQENNGKQSIEFHAQISKENYLKKVKAIQDHIQKGDFYEANFCYEWQAIANQFNAKKTFQELTKLTNAPYKVYADLTNHNIISASPELFLKKRGNSLFSSPIKGTRARSIIPEIDHEMKTELMESEKERAENIMIVDLVRNDLSKVAKKNSVHVDELCKVYSFKNIHQMISTISCELKENISFSELIKATFPMGSMTGAPKIKVMEIMDQYEPSRRGIYSGTIGVIQPNGDFDLNVVIRTLVYNKLKQLLSFHVGGAITMKSSPEDEYQETLVKAASLFKACES